ncbi:putative oxidoreductase YusZ [Lachnellula cervina]|uniref:Putative oxidoreductase YusZ n=1 Tax=Lachnellula cervina TaxID=1316786 RepID=A0A7D8YQJ6_9HELO|nr:putative oxidoreductase YusZ [Lachnellula cervina]
MQWLVTGCSSGLGLELARAILASGHKCIATSRNPSKTPEAVAEIERLGGIWAALDVAASDLEFRLGEIVDKHGTIDVLVNNAGYAAGGPLEAMGIEAIQNQMETNFLGPIRAIKALVPSMRENRSGIIVNISSAEYWDPHAGCSLYSASKFALEGLSESLATELSAFGIRVLIVEPGGMRTSFVAPETITKPVLPDAYKGTMTDFVLSAILAMHGEQKLDPRKAAEAVVEEVLRPCGTPPVLRLPLGKESLEGMRGKAGRLVGNADVCEAVALGADF